MKLNAFYVLFNVYYLHQMCYLVWSFKMTFNPKDDATSKHHIMDSKSHKYISTIILIWHKNSIFDTINIKLQHKWIVYLKCRGSIPCLNEFGHGFLFKKNWLETDSKWTPAFTKEWSESLIVLYLEKGTDT